MGNNHAKRAEAYSRELPEADKDVVIEIVCKDGWALQYANEDAKSDFDVVVEAVRREGAALQYASDDLKENVRIVLAAVKTDGKALRFACEKLRNDRDVVLEAVQSDGLALEFAGDDLRADKFVVIEAAQSNWNSLQHASPTLFADHDVMYAAVSSNGSALSFATKELQDDERIVLQAVKRNGAALKYASPRLSADRTVVFEAVRQCGSALEFADNSLKNCRELVLEAVHRDGSALRFSGDGPLSDREVVFTAVQTHPQALEFACLDLRSDRQIVLAAVAKDWSCLRFVSDDLRDDRAVALAALCVSSHALEMVGPSLRADPSFMSEAARRDWTVLRFADPSMKECRLVLLEALARSEAAFEFVPEGLRRDKGFILDAVTRNPSILGFAAMEARSDRTLVMAAVRCDGAALRFASADLRADREIVKAAVRQDPSAIRYAGEGLRDDPSLVRLSMRPSSGTVLDKDIALVAAMSMHPRLGANSRLGACLRVLDPEVSQHILVHGCSRHPGKANGSASGGRLGELSHAVQAVRRIGGAVVSHPAVGRLISMVSSLPSHLQTTASRGVPCDLARAALRQGDVKGLEEALQQMSLAEVDMADRRGWTLLHHAALDDRPQAVSALLQRGADRNAKTREVRGLHGADAVDRAISLVLFAVIGGLGLVAALVCLGAGVFLNDKVLLVVATALASAAAASFLRPVLLTPRWRLVTNYRAEGARALFMGGVTAILLVLCSQYVAPFRSPNRVPPAAALICAFYGLQRVRRPPRKGARDPMAGATALYIAARSGSESVFEVLLNDGADPTIRTSAGWTVLDAINESESSQRPPAEVAAMRRRMKQRLVAALWQQGLQGIAQMVSGAAQVVGLLVEVVVEGAVVAAALWW